MKLCEMKLLVQPQQFSPSALHKWDRFPYLPISLNVISCNQSTAASPTHISYESSDNIKRNDCILLAPQQANV